MAVPVGRVVVRAAPGDPDTVESLFLTSATAPPLLVGLEIGAERLAVAEVLVLPVALVVVLDVAGFTAGLGLDVLVDTAGFRTVAVGAAALPRFSARVSVLAGE